MAPVVKIPIPTGPLPAWQPNLTGLWSSAYQFDDELYAIVHAGGGVSLLMTQRGQSAVIACAAGGYSPQYQQFLLNGVVGEARAPLRIALRVNDDGSGTLVGAVFTRDCPQGNPLEWSREEP